MNKFLFSLTLCLGIALPSWGDNLLPYVQANLDKTQIQTFSGQVLTFKECDSCPILNIRPSADVSYWAQNQEISLKTATEIYVRGTYDFISVFYNRSSRQYDKLMFDGYNELMPLRHILTPAH